MFFFFLLLQGFIRKKAVKIYIVCVLQGAMLVLLKWTWCSLNYGCCKDLESELDRATLFSCLYLSENKQHISFKELSCLRMWSFSGLDVFSLFHLMSKHHLMLNFQRSALGFVFLYAIRVSEEAKLLWKKMCHWWVTSLLSALDTWNKEYTSAVTKLKCVPWESWGPLKW